MTRAALLLLAVLLLAMSAPSKRLEILRHTRIAWDDEAVTVVVRVLRDGANRSLTVAAIDGTDIVRSSFIQLDGEAARQTYFVEWGPLPAGDLLIRAIVCEARCERPAAVATVPIQVLSRWAGPEP